MSGREALLHAEADRVVPVRAEGWDPLEPQSGVEADRLDLVDAGLEADHGDAVVGRVGGQALDEQLSEALAAERRPHVHALQLRVLALDELDTPAAGWDVADVHDEERDLLAKQLVDAVAVLALDGVEAPEQAVELRDQLARDRAVRPFG